MDLNLHEDNTPPLTSGIMSLINEGMPSMVKNPNKRLISLPNTVPPVKKVKKTAELSLAIPLDKTTDTMVLHRVAEAARQKARDASQPQIRPAGKLRPGRPPKVPDSALSQEELERRNRRRDRNRQCAARERQRNAFYQDLLEEAKQEHIQQVYCLEMDNAVLSKHLELLTNEDELSLATIKDLLERVKDQTAKDEESIVKVEEIDDNEKTQDEAVGTLIQPPPNQLAAFTSFNLPKVNLWPGALNETTK